MDCQRVCSWEKVCLPFSENGLSVRRLEDVAVSYACKKWWKLHNSGGVWARASLSNGWAFNSVGRMADARNLMVQNTQVVVQNGSCSFWFSNWSGLGLLADRLVFFYLPSTTLTLRKVFPDGNWSRHDLDYLFSQEDQRALHQLQFQFSIGMDKLFWVPTHSGNFTIS